MQRDLLCLKNGCNWEGTYEEAISFNSEELAVLKQVLFAEKVYLGKEGYNNIKFFTHMCPKCNSMVLDLNKLKDLSNSNEFLRRVIKEIKSPKTK